jgi:hypothetical protein
VDPDRQTVSAYLNRDGRFEAARELSLEREDVLMTPHFDMLQLPLRKIFQ